MKTIKTRCFLDRLKGHKDGVISIFSPDGPEGTSIYSASKDGGIRIWDLLERKTTLKFYMQSDQNIDLSKRNIVSTVLFKKNIVYGGFEDGSFYSFDLTDGSRINKFNAHTSPLTCLCFLEKNKIISAASDGQMIIWNIETLQCESVLLLGGNIDQIQLYGSNLYILVDKNKLFVINSKDLKQKSVLSFNKYPVISFYIYMDKFFLANINNEFEVYNVEELDQMNPLYVNQNTYGWILNMQGFENLLYCGNDDKTIKIYDLNRHYELVEELSGHEDGVTCIDFAYKFVYTGSFDQTIRSWDVDELKNRIRERQQIQIEDIMSRKFLAYDSIKNGGKKKAPAKKKK